VNKVLHSVPAEGKLRMPTTKHRIAANLTDAEFSELAAMAHKYDVSLAWIGRRAVLDFIDRYRTEQLYLPLRQESQRPRDAAPRSPRVSIPSAARS
jgi:hypothetical protein